MKKSTPNLGSIKVKVRSMSDLLTFALYESTRNVVGSKRFTSESNNRRITYITYMKMEVLPMYFALIYKTE